MVVETNSGKMSKIIKTNCGFCGRNLQCRYPDNEMYCLLYPSKKTYCSCRAVVDNIFIHSDGYTEVSMSKGHVQCFRTEGTE